MSVRKSEVYSWRLAPELKARLEQRAREEGIGLAALLERISREWLRANRASRSADEREQARIKAAAMRAIGSIRGMTRTLRAGERAGPGAACAAASPLTV
jgi:hypothetical protein